MRIDAAITVRIPVTLDDQALAQLNVKQDATKLEDVRKLLTDEARKSCLEKYGTGGTVLTVEDIRISGL